MTFIVFQVEISVASSAYISIHSVIDCTVFHLIGDEAAVSVVDHVMKCSAFETFIGIRRLLLAIQVVTRPFDAIFVLQIIMFATFFAVPLMLRIFEILIINFAIVYKVELEAHLFSFLIIYDLLIFFAFTAYYIF